VSAEHKRPLYAFFAVALVGVLVLAMAARSDALRSFVHREVAAVVAGALLDPAPGREAPRESPDLSTETVEEVLPAAASTTAKQRAHHRGGERAATGRHHRARSAHAGSGHASSGHGKSATAPGHTGVRGPGHGKALGHPKSHGPAKAQGHAGTRGHGHGRAGHGKGHAKGHGKSHGKGHHRH